MTDDFEVPEELRDVEALIASTLRVIPPLEEDPTARLLGLVVDPERELDPAALRRVRQVRKIGPEALASRLQTRGWSVKPLDIITWESRGAPTVVPAIIAALADELKIDPVELTRGSKKMTASRLELLKDRSDVQRLIARLSNIRHTSLADAFALLESSTTSFAYRGAPNDDQYIKTLVSLVDVIERQSQNHG